MTNITEDFDDIVAVLEVARTPMQYVKLTSLLDSKLYEHFALRIEEFKTEAMARSWNVVMLQSVNKQLEYAELQTPYGRVLLHVVPDYFNCDTPERIKAISELRFQLDYQAALHALAARAEECGLTDAKIEMALDVMGWIYRDAGIDYLERRLLPVGWEPIITKIVRDLTPALAKEAAKRGQYLMTYSEAYEGDDVETIIYSELHTSQCRIRLIDKHNWFSAMPYECREAAEFINKKTTPPEARKGWLSRLKEALCG